MIQYRSPSEIILRIMTRNNLYNSLIEIGLEDYLKRRGGGIIHEEKWMVNLDYFVSNLIGRQKRVLKDKIKKKKNETHLQHNDVLHEISIACAFYDSVNFLEENNDIFTPDFRSDSTNVEVKTINNSDIECKRLDTLNQGPYCNISPALNQDEVKQLKEEFIKCVSIKFKDHIEKAKKQIGSNGGHIWVVYAIDSPPKFHLNIHEEIKNRFEKIIKELLFKLNEPKICVKYIHFELLREKIKKIR